MKKAILYTLLIMITILITAGGTYAFLTATISSNSLGTNSSKLDVIYSGDREIGGNLNLTETKEGGYNTTVSIKLAPNSVSAKADIYLDIEEITSTLATEGLVWEAYRKYNNSTTPYSDGTFAKCDNVNTFTKCKSGDRLYLVKDYVLTTSETLFTFYFWLDGNKVGNEILNSVLSGIIKAETEIITTQIG